MKYGTETNSLVNGLYSRMTNGAPVPEVGMGVTMLGWTDRNPGTIVAIEYFKNGNIKYITVANDAYKVVEGSVADGSAVYEITPNFYGAGNLYKPKKNGGYVSVYKDYDGKMVAGSGSMIVGFREKYVDPSF